MAKFFKRLILAAAAMVAAAVPALADIAGAPAGRYIINRSTWSAEQFNVSRSTISSLSVTDLTSGECVQAGTGGRLTTTGSACGAGGGSGDITGVAVSGEGITGGGTSGDVTIVIGSTVAYTTKNQTWTAPQTVTSSVTLSELLGGTTFTMLVGTVTTSMAIGNTGSPGVPLTLLGSGASASSAEFLRFRPSAFVGDWIDQGYYMGGPSVDRMAVLRFTNQEDTVSAPRNPSGFQFLNGDLDSKVVIRLGQTHGVMLRSSGTLEFQDGSDDQVISFRSSDTIAHSQHYLLPASTGAVGSPLEISNIDSNGNVSLVWGTDDAGAGGSGGGYAVEPATVTFQLSKGVTASTGTFTDLLIGTTISASEVFQIDEETALRFIPSSSGTYVGVTRTTGTPAFATFVGHKAGQFANTGSGVTAVGFQACRGAGAGPSDSTTCVGQDAGLVLDGGINNTLIGIKAGQKMTDGSNNVCVGDVACNEVTSGAENVHLGNFAYSYTGTNSQNVLVGFQSQVGAGSRNTCLGTYSCSINTNQADNVAVGYSALIGAGATKAVAIGANATATQSNTMKLGGELSDSVTVLMSSSITSGWSITKGSATFVSSMTLSGGYLVQNIPPSNGQVLKFDGTNWAPGTDSTGGGGGTTIWVQKDDVDVDVSVSTIDVRSPLAVTSSPSGEANLDIDKSSFTLVGPTINLDTPEVTGRVGEGNIVSTAAFTTKNQTWTQAQTYRSSVTLTGTIESVGVKSSTGVFTSSLSVSGLLTGTTIQIASGKIIMNDTEIRTNASDSGIHVYTPGGGKVGLRNSADTAEVYVTNNGTGNFPEKMLLFASSTTLAGPFTNTLAFENEAHDAWVTFVSSPAVQHSQNYVLPYSTGPVGTVLAIDHINSLGKVALAWKTDATGGGGGTTIWVQKDDVDVDVSVSTIDVRSPLNVTSSPSGEANLDVDKSSFTLLGPTIDAAELPSNNRLGSIGVAYDGGGSALTSGGTTYVMAPFSGTVTGWTVVSTSTGSIVVDVKKCAGFNCNPTTSIAGTEKPTLSSVWANEDASLSSWTTSITQGDKIAFVMDSVATITNATIMLLITK